MFGEGDEPSPESRGPLAFRKDPSSRNFWCQGTGAHIELQKLTMTEEIQRVKERSWWAMHRERAKRLPWGAVLEDRSWYSHRAGTNATLT